MNSIQKTARLAGLIYVVFSIISVLGYMVLPPKFMVPGDATATAAKIAQNVFIYRLSILSALVGQILFIFLVLTLYKLFKDVDRGQARLMVALVCVGVAAEIINVSYKFAPLALQSDAEYLSAFTKPQLDALAMTSLQMKGSLNQLITVFWGLWLFPFGVLTIKSGFLPKALGYLLWIAGIGYVVTCMTFIMFPAQLGTVSKVMMPFYFGELPIVFWLLIVGARVPRAEPAAQVSVS